MENLQCLLEALRSLELKGVKPSSPEEVAKELEIGLEEAQRLLHEAVIKGLAKEVDGKYALTPEGLEEMHIHRESVVHNKLYHGASLIGKLSRIMERRLEDIDKHWEAKHGFNGFTVRGLHQGLMDLQGRVEDLAPLTSLTPGGKGVVVFALGGYGLVRRLAEMGLTPGTEVQVVRKAPFRGPIEIMVRGVTLALGFGVASRVIVRPLL